MSSAKKFYASSGKDVNNFIELSFRTTFCVFYNCILGASENIVLHISTLNFAVKINSNISSIK